MCCQNCTVPAHSWRNPAERVMSIVNLGLQCVGLMRTKTTKQALLNCNTLGEIRQAAKNIVLAILDSVAPVKILLSDIMKRIKLKLMVKSFGIIQLHLNRKCKICGQKLRRSSRPWDMGGSTKRMIFPNTLG